MDSDQVARIKARAETAGDYWPASDVVALADDWEVLAEAYEATAARNRELAEEIAQIRSTWEPIPDRPYGEPDAT